MESKKLKLQLEREFNASTEAVFNAIKEGILFLQCGAVKEKMKIDFRNGGKYFLSFGADDEEAGEFTNIKPTHLIEFTWGNNTNVTIQIESRGDKSLLRLTHANIPNEQWLNDYRGGWEDGILGLKSAMKAE